MEARCRAFMDDVERRDLPALVGWFSAEAEMWIPPRPAVHGARRVVALLRAIFRLYPEIHWKVTAVHAIDENRCIYFTDSWGTIGRDTPYSNKIATVIRFDADGRIAFLSDYFKDTTIFAAGRSRFAPAEELTTED